MFLGGGGVRGVSTTGKPMSILGGPPLAAVVTDKELMEMVTIGRCIDFFTCTNLRCITKQGIISLTLKASQIASTDSDSHDNLYVQDYNIHISSVRN